MSNDDAIQKLSRSMGKSRDSEEVRIFITSAGLSEPVLKRNGSVLSAVFCKEGMELTFSILTNSESTTCVLTAVHIYSGSSGDVFFLYYLLFYLHIYKF